jgi:hypothetical protein
MMRFWFGKGSVSKVSATFFVFLISSIVVGCETTTKSTGTSSDEPLQTGVYIPAECVDTAMIGSAGNVYADTFACLADQPTLRESAREAGRQNCIELCKSMTCKATKLAFPKSPQTTCTGRNFNTGQSYGIATTGRFICRCVIPEALKTDEET